MREFLTKLNNHLPVRNPKVRKNKFVVVQPRSCLRGRRATLATIHCYGATLPRGPTTTTTANHLAGQGASWSN